MCNQNFFLKNQIDQKISFVFPQLSLKYILVLVSRVPICGQTLPRAICTLQQMSSFTSFSLSPPCCQYHGQKYCMPFNNRAICKALKKSALLLALDQQFEKKSIFLVRISICFFNWLVPLTRILSAVKLRNFMNTKCAI